MKYPMFDRNRPVFFMAASERLCSETTGDRAIFKRGYYALAGIPVTCWQGSRRVAVPLAEAR